MGQTLTLNPSLQLYREIEHVFIYLFIFIVGQLVIFGSLIAKIWNNFPMTEITYAGNTGLGILCLPRATVVVYLII